ncbi:MAG: IS30 family transposase, partial [Ghiorsea sp.]
MSRELARNHGQRGYRHVQADNKAAGRHKDKPKATKLTDDIKARISSCIEDDWSPEQVAGRLKSEGVITLHHETIYKYVLADKKAGGELYTHLRHQNKRYRKRYGSAHNRNGIVNRVDIDERPKEANNRERIGDWEADTIIGKGHQGAILTLDDRVSKLRLAAPLDGKKAKGVTEGIIKLLQPIKDLVHTITFDNGKEFSFHEQIAKALDCNAYFAKPYHSWERGQNENANGLLRQYFPKAMSLLDVTVKEVLEAVHRLNDRPKKCLDFKT